MNYLKVATSANPSTSHDLFIICDRDKTVTSDCDGKCDIYGELTPVVWWKPRATQGALLNLCRSCCAEAQEYNVRGY